jgi:hypothetical protein
MTDGVRDVTAQTSLPDWLAPPPLVRKDGAVDPEWGLPDERRQNEDDVDPKLKEKLARFHTMKDEQDTHFNESLMRTRAFHNPHIYAKLVEWLDIDESASAYQHMCKDVDVDAIWTATQASRKHLLQEGDAERLDDLQRRTQKELEESKARGKRNQIAFVSSSSKARRLEKDDQAHNASKVRPRHPVEDDRRPTHSNRTERK